MYAIRSYYASEPVLLMSAVSPRELVMLPVVAGGDDAAGLAVAAKTLLLALEAAMRVITSYSIHYTKLYDSSLIAAISASGVRPSFCARSMIAVPWVSSAHM